MSEVTVADLDALVEEIHAKSSAIDGHKAITSQMQKDLEALEQKAVGYLKETNRTSYPTPYGTIYIHNAWRIKLPQGDGNKDQLIAHLKERGLDKKYLTVNSNALNSLFLADWDAVDRDPTFSMPGIDPPVLYQDLRFRSPKE